MSANPPTVQYPTLPQLLTGDAFLKVADLRFWNNASAEKFAKLLDKYAEEVHRYHLITTTGSMRRIVDALDTVMNTNQQLKEQLPALQAASAVNTRKAAGLIKNMLALNDQAIADAEQFAGLNRPVNPWPQVPRLSSNENWLADTAAQNALTPRSDAFAKFDGWLGTYNEYVSDYIEHSRDHHNKLLDFQETGASAISQGQLRALQRAVDDAHKAAVHELDGCRVFYMYGLVPGIQELRRDSQYAERNKNGAVDRMLATLQEKIPAIGAADTFLTQIQREDENLWRENELRWEAHFRRRAENHWREADNRRREADNTLTAGDHHPPTRVDHHLLTEDGALEDGPLLGEGDHHLPTRDHHLLTQDDALLAEGDHDLPTADDHSRTAGGQRRAADHHLEPEEHELESDLPMYGHAGPGFGLSRQLSTPVPTYSQAQNTSGPSSLWQPSATPTAPSSGQSAPSTTLSHQPSTAPPAYTPAQNFPGASASSQPSAASPAPLSVQNAPGPSSSRQQVTAQPIRPRQRFPRPSVESPSSGSQTPRRSFDVPR